MARLPRKSFADYDTFHLTTRGVERRDIVLTDSDRRRWLTLFERTVRRWRWFVYAFCLMDNHYHVVARMKFAALSGGMHHLNGRYAREFNDCYGRWGHLFGDRFSSVPIQNEDHLHHACWYVMENPVRAGLADRIGDWPWAASRFPLDD